MGVAAQVVAPQRRAEMVECKICGSPLTIIRQTKTILANPLELATNEAVIAEFIEIEEEKAMLWCRACGGGTEVDAEIIE